MSDYSEDFEKNSVISEESFEAFESDGEMLVLGNPIDHIIRLAEMGSDQRVDEIFSDDDFQEFQHNFARFEKLDSIEEEMAAFALSNSNSSQKKSPQNKGHVTIFDPPISTAFDDDDGLGFPSLDQESQQAFDADGPELDDFGSLDHGGSHSDDPQKRKKRLKSRRKKVTTAPASSESLESIAFQKIHFQKNENDVAIKIAPTFSSNIARETKYSTVILQKQLVQASRKIEAYAKERAVLMARLDSSEIESEFEKLRKQLGEQKAKITTLESENRSLRAVVSVQSRSLVSTELSKGSEVDENLSSEAQIKILYERVRRLSTKLGEQQHRERSVHEESVKVKKRNSKLRSQNSKLYKYAKKLAQDSLSAKESLSTLEAKFKEVELSGLLPLLTPLSLDSTNDGLVGDAGLSPGERIGEEGQDAFGSSSMDSGLGAAMIMTGGLMATMGASSPARPGDKKAGDGQSSPSPLKLKDLAGEEGASSSSTGQGQKLGGRSFEFVNSDEIIDAATVQQLRVKKKVKASSAVPSSNPATRPTSGQSRPDTTVTDSNIADTVGVDMPAIILKLKKSLDFQRDSFLRQLSLTRQEQKKAVDELAKLQAEFDALEKQSRGQRLTIKQLRAAYDELLEGQQRLQLASDAYTQKVMHPHGVPVISVEAAYLEPQPPPEARPSTVGSGRRSRPRTGVLVEEASNFGVVTAASSRPPTSSGVPRTLTSGGGVSVDVGVGVGGGGTSRPGSVHKGSHQQQPLKQPLSKSRTVSPSTATSTQSASAASATGAAAAATAAGGSHGIGGSPPRSRGGGRVGVGVGVGVGSDLSAGAPIGVLGGSIVGSLGSASDVSSTTLGGSAPAVDATFLTSGYSRGHGHSGNER